jgi:hypothetical protein
MNAETCLGPAPGWRNARPVYSADGVDWRRAEAAEYLPHRGRFRFYVPVIGRSVWIAYCYPYTAADLTAFLARLPQVGAATEFCRSEGGRSVPYVRLGNHETPRKSVWILARQHAGETPASFVAEGLLDRLATTEAEALRELAVHVAPMVDVDGVEEGRFGKDQEPVDFNRDWRDIPVRPAVRAVLDQIRGSQRKAPVQLVLDLHAPHQGDPVCYFFGDDSHRFGKPDSQIRSRFLELLSQEGSERVGFRPTDIRETPAPRGSARQFLTNQLCAPVLTLEMSYHQAQSGHFLTPHDYRAFGVALARVIARLFTE